MAFAKGCYPKISSKGIHAIFKKISPSISHSKTKGQEIEPILYFLYASRSTIFIACMGIIGILGVHGSREEHAHHMQKLGFETRFIRKKEDGEGIVGLIFPGGESTSFGRLMDWSGIREMLIEKIVTEKIPVLGTCAGAILLSSAGSEYSMNVLDITVDRNAYGSQVDSFSDEVYIPILEEYFHSIFIRAPKIVGYGPSVEVLAEYNNTPILVQNQEHTIMAATFHPELSDSLQIHRIFADMITKKKNHSNNTDH